MKKHVSLFVSLMILATGLMVVPVNAQESCVMGDVTNDGIVSISDAHYVLTQKNSYNPNNNEYSILGDLDYNSSYTDEDVYQILKIASGIQASESVQFGDWTLAQTPTCEDDGYYTSYCETKNLTRYKAIKSTGHSVVNGVCQICNEMFVDMDSICVYEKVLKFGDSEATLKTVLGNPTEILKDKAILTSLVYYVYAYDYSKLSVFTIEEGKGIVGFYTNDKSAKVKFTKDYTIDSFEENTWYEDYHVSYYFDEIVTKKPYAMYAVKSSDPYKLYPYSNFTTNSKLIFYSTNGCRAINGVAALNYNEKLCQMALYHSNDMATNNYFSHDAPNGESLAERVEKFGVNCFYCGENIMAGYPLNAYDFTNGWYNSEGHRRNMLDSNYQELGVAISYNESSDYLYYSTQNFALMT